MTVAFYPLFNADIWGNDPSLKLEQTELWPPPRRAALFIRHIL